MSILYGFLKCNAINYILQYYTICILFEFKHMYVVCTKLCMYESLHMNVCTIDYVLQYSCEHINRQAAEILN